VEVVLIQKYALLIGPSVYSIMTVLLTLLVMAGLGSRLSDRLGDRWAFAGIIGCLLLDVFVYRPLIDQFVHLTQGPRVLLAGLLVAPLGFFMGMPFPKAGRRVGELVDWGFAVNGAGSVFGATAILLVAFSYGFGPALLVGLALYLLAFGLLGWRRAW
jgi:hypothetical protein